jgi:hypothetical protein
MTIEREALVSDLFGLAGTFPRPGWVVLDSARDHRFTGELVFDTYPEVRVYVDRGRFYLAERTTDPSLGSRLVDSGALTAVQLEHGALRFGGDENLGRLFERVPSVDRHTVLVATELMTEACVGWVASQKVSDASSTPYRHHVSGVHRWDRPLDAIDLSPGDPLPAPPQNEPPISVPSPEPLFNPERFVDPDDVIQWDQRSWLDDRTPTRMPERRFDDRAIGDPVPAPEASATKFDDDNNDDDENGSSSLLDHDWVDDIELSGLPDQGSDPLAAIVGLPNAVRKPDDRFELIWPTGEIDEQFGGTDVASIEDRHPDLDRGGPTARMGRLGSALEGAPPDLFARPPETLGEVETLREIAQSERTEDPGGPALKTATTVEREDEADDLNGPEAIDQEVLLAVRRAVASIETGSLASRTRLVDDRDATDLSRGTDVDLPGRIAVRAADSEWASNASVRSSVSVFDSVVSEPPAVETNVEPSSSPVRSPAVEPEDDSTDRTSALRRLIGSLRRSDSR